MKIFIKHRGLLCLLLILCLTLTMTVCAAAEDAAESEPARPNVVVDYLTSHAPLLLFICIGLGYIVGKITIKNKNHVRIFTVGPTAGTLLVGLIVSQFISVELPAALSTVFFSLFCFAIGFEVGPSFFASLKNTGIKIVAMAAFFALTGLGTAYAVCRIAGFDVGVGVGMLAGALTQTSIIGAAQLDGDMAANATVAYALTYVFGTLGVILFVKNVAPLILNRKLPMMVKKKMDSLSGDSRGKSSQRPINLLQLRAYCVGQESRYVGMTVDQLETANGERLEVVAVYRGGALLELTEEHPLLSGDVIQLVGDVDALNCADDLGLCEVTDPAYYQVQVVNRKLVLTKSFPTAEGAALLSGYGVLTNAGDDENAFARGKILSVTGSDVAIREVAKRMGYIKDEGNETDIAFMSLAIAVGLFVGSLAVTLSDLSLSLGESVGVLLAGLVCGWLYNKNPRYGRVPQATGSFLRSLGLNLYIGALALRVGGSFREAMTGNGWLILLLGAIVTLVPHLLSLLFGKFVLKLDDTDLLGGLCGSGTCTAALNSLTEETNSSVFTFGYAPGCAAGNILLTVMGLLLPFLL